MTEEKVEQTKSIGTFYKEIYEVIQKEPFYRLFIFRYFTKIFAAVWVTASSNIQSIYAGVTPLNDVIAACISQVLIVAGLFSIKKWGLQWNWQYLAIFSQLFAVFVDAFPTYFTIWNVFRSQWFWLGVPLLEDFVGEFVDYATTITMVEIAEPGREATSMGFLGSITAAGTVITKSVDSYFEIGQKALKRDDHAVHVCLPHCLLVQHRGSRVRFLVAAPKARGAGDEAERQQEQAHRHSFRRYLPVLRSVGNHDPPPVAMGLDLVPAYCWW